MSVGFVCFRMNQAAILAEAEWRSDKLMYLLKKRPELTIREAAAIIAGGGTLQKEMDALREIEMNHAAEASNMWRKKNVIEGRSGGIIIKTIV